MKTVLPRTLDLCLHVISSSESVFICVLSLLFSESALMRGTSASQDLSLADHALPAPPTLFPSLGNPNNQWAPVQSSYSPVYTIQPYACYPYSTNTPAVFPCATSTFGVHQVSLQGDGFSQYHSSHWNCDPAGAVPSSVPEYNPVELNPPGAERVIVLPVYETNFPNPTQKEVSVSGGKANVSQAELGDEIVSEEDAKPTRVEQSMIATLRQFYSEIKNVSREDGRVKKSVRSPETSGTEGLQGRLSKEMSLASGTDEREDGYMSKTDSVPDTRPRGEVATEPCPTVDCIRTEEEDRGENGAAILRKDKVIVSEKSMNEVEVGMNTGCISEAERRTKELELSDELESAEAVVSRSSELKSPSDVNMGASVWRNRGGSVHNSEETNSSNRNQPPRSRFQQEPNPSCPQRVDPLAFLSTSRRRFFTSMSSLRSLCDVSSAFDQIAREAIAATVLSLESIVWRASTGKMSSKGTACDAEFVTDEMERSSNCSSPIEEKSEADEECEAVRSTERGEFFYTNPVPVFLVSKLGNLWAGCQNKWEARRTKANNLRRQVEYHAHAMLVLFYVYWIWFPSR